MRARGIAGKTAMIVLAGGQVMAGPTGADEIGRGHDLAQRLCAVCHLNPGQGEKAGPDGIPGFVAVARRRGQTPEQIVKWLRSRPAAMPDHGVTLDEAYALAAYIMSLRAVN